MLVSSIARFNAAQSMNNAAFGIMQNYTQMSNSVSNSTFGGENFCSGVILIFYMHFKTRLLSLS